MDPEPDRRPRAAWLGVTVASVLLLLAGGAAPAVAESFDADAARGGSSYGVGLKELQGFDKHQRRRSREAGN